MIRGVESHGMLCSGAELELSEDHDGILELPADAPVGRLMPIWAGLDDPVIEINLTPNRPDAMGVHGIARDLAAAGLGRLKTHPMTPSQGRFPCPVSVRLDFDRERRASRAAFALRLVRGVKTGPSPEWLQKRLKAIGLRPINALVDITNYLDLRPRPAAACLRCEEGARQSRGAPRQELAKRFWRSTAGPMGSTRAWSSSPTTGRRIDRRHHGRRSSGCD